MTTFWARMLIFNECKNPGKFSTGLPEDAAMYFDELLEKNSKHRVKTGVVNDVDPIYSTIPLEKFNDSEDPCVLKNIGMSKSKEFPYVPTFDVVKYIKATTYICNEVYDNTFIVHLASLIGEEYAGLDNNISSLIKHGNPSIEDLKLIKSYLYDTKYLPTKKGTPRDASYLIDLIDYQIRNIRNEQDLSELRKKESENDKELIMF